MTSTSTTPLTASAAVAVALVKPKVGGIYNDVPFFGGTRDQLLARPIAGTAGAALGVGAQPTAAQSKVRGIYDKVHITGGARDSAHMPYG